MPAVDTETAQETLSFLEKVMRNFSWETAAMVLFLLVASVVIIKFLLRLADKAMERGKLERGARKFLASGLKVLLWLVAICAILGYIGVPMTSLVAVLSVLGLAVSLAVQGLLSNLAGGIMLLSARPFSAGDFVEAGGVSGTVQEVGLVYTKLTTVDNKVVHVPNGDISSKTIVNYTGAEKRQVEWKLSVSYDADAQAVRRAITQVLGDHPLTHSTPEPLIRVFSYNDSSVEWLVRCWCATGDYWTVYFDFLERIRPAFDAAGVEMTYPHVNVHMMEK